MNILNLFTITRYVKPKKVRVPIKRKRKTVKQASSNELGKYIRKFRKKRGYNQYQLAPLVGRSKSWISRVERGVYKLKEEDVRNLDRVLKINIIRKQSMLNQ